MDYTTCDIPIGSYAVIAPRDIFTQPFIREVKAVTRCFVYLRYQGDELFNVMRHRRGILALIPPGISTEGSRAALLGRLMDAWHATPGGRAPLIAAYRKILDEVLNAAQ